MKAGDLIISQRKNGEWATTKILEIDAWPDGSEIFHCLCYKATREKPTSASVHSLDVHVHHVPIDSADFKANWHVLCSSPIEESDLLGFVEYLKHTNFPRYVEVTKQDSRKIVEQANSHYRAAYALGDEGKKLESIHEYTKAIDLFPLFFEAIDNRAFTYMELGDFPAALHDFEASLTVNPDGNSAFFSRGECFLKLGMLDEAEQVFLEGSHRFPEHQANYLRFLEVVRARKDLSNGDAAARSSPTESRKIHRPWWKFWV